MNKYPGWADAAPKLEAAKRKNKYGATRVQIDGVWFDSKDEGRRYRELQLMQASGLISNLETHPAYKIIYNDYTICVVELDFKYLDLKTGEYVIEDVKGKDNAGSILKRKLVEAFHKIKVKVVSQQRAIV